MISDSTEGVIRDDDDAPDGPPRDPYAVQPHDYQQLARPFTVTFRDLRGGVELEYVTGEQVTSRLNEDLGFDAWDFEIVEHGINAEADECWVLGKLTARILRPDPNLPGELTVQTVVKTQFGSQKVKRSRSSGNPLDIGFDLKGAATDAMKKCASLLGVALYLWKKEPPCGLGTGGRPPQNAPRNDPPQNGTTSDRPRPRPGDGGPSVRGPQGPVDQPKPTAQAATQEQIDQYEATRAEAVSSGFTAPWIDKDPAKEEWTDLQLNGYRSLLQRHLDRAPRRSA